MTLIICEGESERIYFDALRRRLRLSTAEVLLPNPLGSAPITVVDYAVRKAREPGGYDFIYCVIDRDQHESFDRALDKLRANARRYPLQASVNIPCFEYWLLLHWEHTDAPFQRCDDVVARLDRHLPGYSKANRKQVEGMLDLVEGALERAEILFPDRAASLHNPHTSAHRLVRHLQDVAAKDLRA